MTYQTKTRQSLKDAPSTLGVRLGRAAIRKNMSVQDIAARTGASRTTIYSWFAGGNVTNAYRTIVEALVKELRST